MTDAKPPAAGGEPTDPRPRPDGEPERTERVVIRDKRKVRVDGTAPAGGKPAGAATGDRPEPTKAAKAGPTEPAEGGSTGAAAVEPDPAKEAPAKEASAKAKGTARVEPKAAPDGTLPPAEPTTTEPAEPAAADAAEETDGGERERLRAELDQLRAQADQLQTSVDERTRDLQRVTAEYANYRKRVERDRALAGEEAVANVFRSLLPVFDDLDRAREHGELSEGVSAVVDQLMASAGKFGLTGFGEPGDPFDPNRHEAVAHRTSAEVDGPTCVEVFRRGYLLGERLLRPAMVAVADPEE